MFTRLLQTWLVAAWPATALLALGAAPPAVAQERAKYVLTHPQPPKVKPAPELRIYPGIQVPTEPEKFVWKTTLRPGADGREVGSEIKVFAFDSAGHRQQIGVIPPETVIKLEAFRRGGFNLYYQIPWNGQFGAGPDKGKPVTFAWISGHNVYAADYAAPAK